VFRKISNVTAIAAVLLIVGAVGIAAASTESLSDNGTITFAPGSFAINKQTCKFLHPEVDKPLGTSWAVGRVWSLYEDGRHDVKMNCNTARQTRVVACITSAPPISERVDHKGGWADEKGAAAAWAYLQACVKRVAS